MLKNRLTVSQNVIYTPVLFLVFNRPDLSLRVFNRIRQVRPTSLYVAADAPRPDVEGETERCREVKKLISDVNWDCKVSYLFHEKHMGCKLAVCNAIDWFFNHEEYGIIIEDDCLPSRSFFLFCQELLEKYRNDERIMHIAGTNLHFGKTFGDGSYYFSRYNLIWGWATWKRAWQLYDKDMKTLPVLKRRYDLERILPSYKEFMLRMALYEEVYSEKIDTWDFQWHYATRINSGLAIHPNENLVQNIGFSKNATHTTNEKSKVAENAAKEILFPLEHPEFILVNRAADKDLFARYYSGGSLLYSLKELVPKQARDYVRYFFDRL